MPIIVARGMVRSGSATLPSGMVADSRPSSANSVSVADAVTAPAENGTAAFVARLSSRTEKIPTAAIASSGRTFSTVVTPWTQPAARTPTQLTAVRIHRIVTTTAALTCGSAPIRGAKGTR